VGQNGVTYYVLWSGKENGLWLGNLSASLFRIAGRCYIEWLAYCELPDLLSNVKLNIKCIIIIIIIIIISSDSINCFLLGMFCVRRYSIPP
jgi:hypothetical protein